MDGFCLFLLQVCVLGKCLDESRLLEVPKMHGTSKGSEMNEIDKGMHSGVG